MSVSTTAADLIKLALKTAGVLSVGQSGLAEDYSDALIILNSMISSWAQNRWLMYHLLDISCPTTGAQFYTVGLTGDLAVSRPARLETAYIRLMPTVAAGAGRVDYPLAIIETYEEYSAISLKQLTSFPTVAFYDPAVPLGRLFVWPVPKQQFEVHIIVKDTLAQFANLTGQFVLPPEYFEALFYNLVGRLQILYQMPVNPGVVALASAALNTIRVANHRVASLRLPTGLARGRGWAMHGVGGVTEGVFSLDVDLLG